MGEGETPQIALVVLGAAVWTDGRPSPTLRRRATHGARLLAEGKAQVAVLSGGEGRNPPSEAQVMFDICREEGISNERLIREDKSTTTLENVALSARLLQELGIKSVIVVTDSYHIPRARMCFRYLGFDVTGSAPPVGEHETHLRRTSWYWLRELMALPYYRLTLARKLSGVNRQEA